MSHPHYIRALSITKKYIQMRFGILVGVNTVSYDLPELDSHK
jgi:hypothetical protein